jgi:hypothetical protein
MNVSSNTNASSENLKSEDGSIPLRPSAKLRALLSSTADDSIEIDEIVRQLGGSTPGFLLLVLTLPAMIPTGLPIAVPAGAAMMVIGAFMIAGQTEITMPSWLAHRSLTKKQLRYVVKFTDPVMTWLERMLTPRWAAMMKPRQLRFVGLIVAVNGFLILLPIPFGNSLPALAVMVMALGMMLGDGVAILSGILLTGLALVIGAAIVALSFEVLTSLFA